ncbi:MAG TPA: MFS transporter [Amycolatopsis sp.]|nr:MFS transporter [Amycolatopsis sp.]
MTVIDRPTARRHTLPAMLFANAISVAGTKISAMAVPWFVLTTTGSATKTGLVVAFELAPMVLAKALGGPIIDRVGARKVSIVADIASAFAVLLIPVLHGLGLLGFPLLLAIVAVTGVARGPGDTSKNTLTPDIADATGTSLERVAGLVSTTERIAMIASPALAGIVIGTIGAPSALVLDAASFAVCAAGTAIWAPRVTRQATEDEPYLRQLALGWQFLAREPLMRAMVGMLSVTNLIDTAYSAVLLPIWIHDDGHTPAELGFITSAFAVTAAIAAALAAVYGERLPRRALYLAGFVLAGVPRFVVMALGAPIWLVIGVGVLGGFGAGFINPILNAIFVERIPRDLLGRVGSLAESVSWAGMPLGGGIAGLAITAFGLVPALVAAGGLYLVATVLPGLLPQWREMDAHHDKPAQSP